MDLSKASTPQDLVDIWEKDNEKKHHVQYAGARVVRPEYVRWLENRLIELL